MAGKVPSSSLAREWQPRSRSLARGQTGELFGDEQQRRERNVPLVYEVRERAVAAAGGADALVALLDERPSYLATVSKCLNRSDEGRRFPVDWDAALLLDTAPATEIIQGYAAIAGLEVTVQERVEVDPDDARRAAYEVLRDLQRSGLDMDTLLARKLGLRPGTVRL